MSGVQAIGELLCSGREQVPVSIHRDLDRGMTQMDLDRFWVGPIGDQQRRTGVSEIVRSQLEANGLHCGLPRKRPVA